MPLFRRNTAPPAAPVPHHPSAEVTAPPGPPPVVDPDPHLKALDRQRADLLRRLVETVLEERGEGGMGRVGPESFVDGSGRRHPLGDLAIAVAPLDLTAWKGVITDHVAGTAAPVSPDALSDEDFRERLRVRLTARGHIAPSVADLAPDFLPDVAQELVLHAPGLLHTVTAEELTAHGTYDEMVTVALEHTREMVEHVQGVTIPEKGPDRITVVVGPEQFTATLATELPQVLHHATGESDWGHGVLVAIPTRAKLLFRVVDGADAVGSLVRLFQHAQQAFESEPGPVSPHVYWVHDGVWQQATGPDASGAASILVHEELQAELTRAGWA